MKIMPWLKRHQDLIGNLIVGGVITVGIGIVVLMVGFFTWRVIQETPIEDRPGFSTPLTTTYGVFVMFLVFSLAAGTGLGILICRRSRRNKRYSKAW